MRKCTVYRVRLDAQTEEGWVNNFTSCNIAVDADDRVGATAAISKAIEIKLGEYNVLRKRDREVLKALRARTVEVVADEVWL